MLTKLNPLTYLVQPMRSVVFAHLDLPAGMPAALDPSISWFGWHVPVAVQVLVAVVCAVAVLSAAVIAFDRTD